MVGYTPQNNFGNSIKEYIAKDRVKTKEHISDYLDIGLLSMGMYEKERDKRARMIGERRLGKPFITSEENNNRRERVRNLALRIN